MATFIIEHLAEIIFSLITAGLLAFCKHINGKYKKLKALSEADENRRQRQIILDEIEPIVQELVTIHEEIDANYEATEKEIAQLKAESESTHKQMYADLNTIQAGNDRNFTVILASYKFRLIQLCKTHLKDGYISSADFEQVTEMYRLYHELGGNGQAKDYYDKVMALEIKD